MLITAAGTNLDAIRIFIIIAAMPITLTVPAERHVKNYLEKNVLLSTPYTLSATDPYGLFLMQLLQGKKHEYEYRGIKPSDRLEIIIGNKSCRQSKIILPDAHACVFNHWVTRIIKHEFYTYLITAIELTERAKVDRLIWQFVNKYELHETELNFNALKRNFYRHREKIGIPKKKKSLPELTLCNLNPTPNRQLTIK
jgi:hypothetical protein